MQGSESSMQREVIRTADAPQAIGPYSQAIAVRGGRTVYTSTTCGMSPGPRITRRSRPRR